MSAHTPGPWTLKVCSAGGLIVRRGDVQSLQIVPKADAHLIAAAPELLEALREMVNRWESADDDPAYVSRARAAIAKAEGK